MQCKFTFKHLQPLESITEYAQNRVDKIDRLTMHKELAVHFIFSVQKEDQIAEVIADSGSNHHTAIAKDVSLYTAIDEVVDKLERQLKKYKDKKQHHHVFESSNEGYLRKELADQARAHRMEAGEHGVSKGKKTS